MPAAGVTPTAADCFGYRAAYFAEAFFFAVLGGASFFGAGFFVAAGLAFLASAFFFGAGAAFLAGLGPLFSIISSQQIISAIA